MIGGCATGELVEDQFASGTPFLFISRPYIHIQTYSAALLELPVRENCSFEACEIGIGLSNCRDVSIVGSLEADDREAGSAGTRSQFSRCAHGAITEDSIVDLRNMSVVGAGGSVGVYIKNKTEADEPMPAQMSNCFVSGFEKCIAVRHCDAALTDMTIDCQRQGIVADST